jgi:hypothetical protein
LPLSAVPFVSVDDLGDLIGQDLTSSDSALIAVDAACDICRDEAEQTFNAVNNDSIVLDGTGTDALMLPELPVNGIDSVAIGDDDPLTVDDDYVLNGQGVLLRAGTTWTVGRQNIAVTYDHGFADEVFPRSVREVALDIAKQIFAQMSTAGITSESLGQYSITYNTSELAQQGILVDWHRRILRKYRTSKSF